MRLTARRTMTSPRIFSVLRETPRHDAIGLFGVSFLWVLPSFLLPSFDEYVPHAPRPRFTYAAPRSFHGFGYRQLGCRFRYPHTTFPFELGCFRCSGRSGRCRHRRGHRGYCRTTNRHHSRCDDWRGHHFLHVSGSSYFLGIADPPRLGIVWVTCGPTERGRTWTTPPAAMPRRPTGRPRSIGRASVSKLVSSRYQPRLIICSYVRM